MSQKLEIGSLLLLNVAKIEKTPNHNCAGLFKNTERPIVIFTKMARNPRDRSDAFGALVLKNGLLLNVILQEGDFTVLSPSVFDGNFLEFLLSKKKTSQNDFKYAEPNEIFPKQQRPDIESLQEAEKIESFDRLGKEHIVKSLIRSLMALEAAEERIQNDNASITDESDTNNIEPIGKSVLEEFSFATPIDYQPRLTEQPIAIDESNKKVERNILIRTSSRNVGFKSNKEMFEYLQRDSDEPFLTSK